MMPSAGGNLAFWRRPVGGESHDLGFEGPCSPTCPHKKETEIFVGAHSYTSLSSAANFSFAVLGVSRHPREFAGSVQGSSNDGVRLPSSPKGLLSGSMLLFRSLLLKTAYQTQT